MNNNPSLSWERLQSVFYRTQVLQSTEHKATSLGVCMYLSTEQNETKIFSYTDELLLYLNHDSLPSMHLKSVLEEDRLVIVMRDRIRVYSSLLTHEFREHSIIGKDSLPLSIWDYKDGIVISTEFEIYMIYHKERIFPDLSFSLLIKDHWFTNKSQLVLLDSTGKVIIGNLVSKKMNVFEGYTGWYKGCISEYGYICLVNGKLKVLTIFETNFNDPLIECHLDELPKDLAWCGNDLICCTFGDDEIRLIGSDSEYASFWFSSRIFGLQSTTTGLKVILESHVELVSKVPEHTSKIFSIGSTAPGAILLDSLSLLQHETNSSKAIENLKIINVKKAVDDCVSAAGDEIDSLWQKRLLSAASFGKDSLSSKEFNAPQFVMTCNYLRVLNSLKSVGIYMNLSQFLSMGIDDLVGKLIDIGKIYESYQVIDRLKSPHMIPTVFLGWCRGKLFSSSECNDDELYDLISDRAKDIKTPLHLSTVANVAFADGRLKLARQLALDDQELVPKIDILLKMDEIDTALKVSNMSKAVEVILFLLLYSKKEMSNAQFTKTLVLTMNGNNLYQYFEKDNFSLLFDYFRQTDDYLSLSRLIWKNGRRQGQETTALLDQVSELHRKFNSETDSKSDRTLFDRAKKLILYQQELSNKYGIQLYDQTADETLIALIKMGQKNEQRRMINDFKISERKYYFLKCTCLAKEHKLKELYSFSQERKSPVGYFPFFKAVLKYESKKEAAVYVDMLTSFTYADKLDLYLECEAYQEAMELASREKDVIGLKQVINKIPPNETQLRSLAMQHLHNL